MFHFERVNRTIRGLAPSGGGRSSDLTIVGRYEALEFAAFAQFNSTPSCTPSQTAANDWCDTTADDHIGENALDGVWVSAEETQSTSGSKCLGAEHEVRWTEQHLFQLARTLASVWAAELQDCMEMLPFLQCFQDAIHNKPHATTIQEWLPQHARSSGQPEDVIADFTQLCNVLGTLPGYSRACVKGINFRGSGETTTLTPPELISRMKESSRFLSCWTMLDQDSREIASRVEIAHVQTWTYCLLGTEPHGCFATAFAAVDCAALSEPSTKFVTTCSIIALLPLHPWNLQAHLRKAVPGKRVELTWRLLSDLAGDIGLVLAEYPVDVLESRGHCGIWVGFKWDEGWAFGEIESKVTSRTDISAGLTHIVRFDDGVFPVTLDTEKAVCAAPAARSQFTSSSWCVWQ